MFDATCFPAFVGASDVISSVLSIHKYLLLPSGLEHHLQQLTEAGGLVGSIQHDEAQQEPARLGHTERSQDVRRGPDDAAGQVVP